MNRKRLEGLIQRMLSEAWEREMQATVYRDMREWSHAEASEAESSALRKWAKKFSTEVAR